MRPLHWVKRLVLSGALLLGTFFFVVVGGQLAVAATNGGRVVLDFDVVGELPAEVGLLVFVGGIFWLGVAYAIEWWTG